MELNRAYATLYGWINRDKSNLMASKRGHNRMGLSKNKRE